MTATQFMPFFDIYLRKKLNIISRIVWYYDSSGVQAKNKYGSLYEPILFCVKDEKNYIGKKLVKELKTYEKPSNEFALKLFEPNRTSIYGNH
jgi:site-specific DNA-methyltransferase (adenine-specific)